MSEVSTYEMKKEEFAGLIAEYETGADKVRELKKIKTFIDETTQQDSDRLIAEFKDLLQKNKIFKQITQFKKEDSIFPLRATFGFDTETKRPVYKFDSDELLRQKQAEEKHKQEMAQLRLSEEQRRVAEEQEEKKRQIAEEQKRLQYVKSLAQKYKKLPLNELKKIKKEGGLQEQVLKTVIWLREVIKTFGSADKVLLHIATAEYLELEPKQLFQEQAREEDLSLPRRAALKIVMLGKGMPVTAPRQIRESQSADVIGQETKKAEVKTADRAATRSAPLPAAHQTSVFDEQWEEGSPDDLTSKSET